MFNRIFFFVSTTCLALVACTSSEPVSSGVYGTYVPVAIDGSAHFFEGDIITVTKDGYRHVHFSDEIEPWSDSPPFQEYGGEAIYDGNKIHFVESWLDPPERFFVQIHERTFLLTPTEYERYVSIGELPDYSLQKRQDEISQ